MKKMKRFLVTLLSSLTAIACIAGITACNDKEEAATESSASTPSFDITINKNDGAATTCAHEIEYNRLNGTACNEPGVVIVSCAKCGEVFQNLEQPAGGHAINAVAKKAATCTEDGYEAYTNCLVCGLFKVGEAWIKSDIVTIPATGHVDCMTSSNENAEVAAIVANKKLESCKANAYSEEFYFCSAQYAEAVKAVEYKLLKTNDAKADYLFTSGLVNTVGYEVKVADHKFVDFFTAKDSKTGKVITLKPTCEVEGLNNFKYCVYCTEGVSKVSKTDFAAIKAFFTADANEDGIIDVVSQGFDAAIVAANGHNFTKKDGTSTFFAGTQATCEDPGTEWYGLCQNANCDVAGGKVNMENGKAKEVKATGHDVNFENADSKKATCSEKAFCGNCGEYYGDALAHKTVKVAAADATCVVAGNTEGVYCTKCDYNTVVVIPATGHNFIAKYIQKETAEKNYKCGETYVVEDYVVCYNCKEAVATVEYMSDNKTVKAYELADFEDVVELREHDLDWSEIHEDSVEDYEDDKHVATCEKAGTSIKVWCNNCGSWDKDEEAFEGDWVTYKEDKLNHVETTEDGYEYTVTSSGKIEVSVKYETVDYKVATACDEDMICELCDEKTADALDHSWIKDEDGKYVITIVAATCTSEGVAPYVECEECGALAWVKDYAKYLNGTALEKCIALTVVDEDGNTVEVDEDLLETEAIPHEYVEIKNGREATCTKVGYTITVYECKHCGAIDETKLPDDIDVDDITIEVKDHASQNEGSCLDEVKCDTCDEMISNSAGDHAYGTDGVCKVCGALCAHDYDAENECTVCHNIKKDE